MKWKVWLTIFITLSLIQQAVGYNYPKISEYPWGYNPTLNVYIDDKNVPEGYHPAYKQSVINALQWWEKGGNGKLNYDFKFQVDRPDAQITIRWVKEVKGEIGGVANIEFQDGGKFAKVDILLELGYTRPGALVWVPHTDFDMDAFAKHEIGHALGLDHSDDFNDIMYPTHITGQRGIIPAYFEMTWPLILILFLLFTFVGLRALKKAAQVKKTREEIVLACAKCGYKTSIDITNCPKCGSNVWK